MKFLCLGHFDREKMDALSKAELDAVMGPCMPHLEALYATGQVLLDAGLDVQTTHLRRADGKVVVTAGATPGPREAIGSAFVIEARDLEDAIRVASLHPTVQVAAGERLGWRLELRPIHHFEEPAPKP